MKALKYLLYLTAFVGLGYFFKWTYKRITNMSVSDSSKIVRIWGSWSGLIFLGILGPWVISAIFLFIDRLKFVHFNYQLTLLFYFMMGVYGIFILTCLHPLRWWHWPVLGFVPLTLIVTIIGIVAKQFKIAPLLYLLSMFKGTENWFKWLIDYF